jgi:hypothetical protein
MTVIVRRHLYDHTFTYEKPSVFDRWRQSSNVLDLGTDITRTFALRLRCPANLLAIEIVRSLRVVLSKLSFK